MTKYRLGLGRPASDRWEGAEPDEPSQHGMLVLRPARVQSARPTCGGSSTASERGTAANALYACLTFNGNSSGDRGEGARGCREGEESWKVSPCGKEGRGRGEDKQGHGAEGRL